MKSYEVNKLEKMSTDELNQLRHLLDTLLDCRRLEVELKKQQSLMNQYRTDLEKS